MIPHVKTYVNPSSPRHVLHAIVQLMTTRLKLSALAIVIVVGALIATLVVRPPVAHIPAKNPDPEHNHADFAVWINGKQLDFSDAKYMTTEEEEAAAPIGSVKKYFHLHDGDGHVMHRHKPGLTLCEFFDSLNNPKGRPEFSVRGTDFFYRGTEYNEQLYVNGVLQPDVGCSYVFNDGDHLLITNDTDATEVQKELSLMTDDGCRYSKTCPWKGPPPDESCVADPTVPCKIQ